MNVEGLFLFASTLLMAYSVRKRLLRNLASTISPKNSLFIQPPIAKKVLEKIHFGFKKEQFRGDNPINPPVFRDDYYQWLRDDTRESKEVIKHLEAENQFCKQKLSHLNDLQDNLYKEMVSHLKGLILILLFKLFSITFLYHRKSFRTIMT
jgi:hypothetical protein